MKNTASNKLLYTGIVTLSQYIGKKKVKIAQFHNTGGASLFSFFADCLIADNFDKIKAQRPKKVMLIQRYPNGETEEEGYRYEPASGFIFTRGNGDPDMRDNESRIRYEFLITRDQLETVDDYNNLGIGLFSQSATDIDASSGNFLAFCMLNFSRNAIAGSSLAIDWELVISNGGTNTANKRI